MVQLKNHVANGFDSPKMVISLLKISLALKSKKLIENKLEALCDEDPSQTPEGLVGTLGVIQ